MTARVLAAFYSRGGVSRFQVKRVVRVAAALTTLR